MANVASQTDYYAFGSEMRARTSGGGYRYGFNGKEKLDEVDGVKGADYDYGMRSYNARIGRFFSVDPLTAKYPMLTPYQYASTRPIDGIDLDGKEHYKVKAADLGDGTTLILVTLVPNGLGKPFQVDLNDKKVNKTNADWGYIELQKNLGTLYKVVAFIFFGFYVYL